jgi:hypothetical protein
VSIVIKGEDPAHNPSMLIERSTILGNSIGPVSGVAWHGEGAGVRLGLLGIPRTTPGVDAGTIDPNETPATGTLTVENSTVANNTAPSVRSPHPAPRTPHPPISNRHTGSHAPPLCRHHSLVNPC